MLGAVLGARGEHARARELLAAYDIDHGWICRWAPVLVESDIALGDLAAARAHAERAAALAPATGMAGARAAAGRAQALVALADGDAPRAAALALAAAAEARPPGRRSRRRGIGWSPAGRCSPRPRRRRRAADRRGRAGGRLRRPARGGRGAARAAPSGRAVGPRRRRARPGAEGLDALSPREREIAELVAEGLTNREIAARLFLSEKTVETHLTRVFQKLGLRSRAQVAAAVARPG